METSDSVSGKTSEVKPLPTEKSPEAVELNSHRTLLETAKEEEEPKIKKYRAPRKKKDEISELEILKKQLLEQGKLIEEQNKKIEKLDKRSRKLKVYNNDKPPSSMPLLPPPKIIKKLVPVNNKTWRLIEECDEI